MHDHDITRFSEMYDRCYERVAAELRNGRKESHWMWFIFPQIRGLGHSETSVYYAIRNLDEARAFLSSSCGERMRRLLDILLKLPTRDPEAVFGHIDAVKLASSMTLFAEAEPHESIFRQVLDKFYHGRPDRKTLEILNRGKSGSVMTPQEFLKEFFTADGHPAEAEPSPAARPQGDNDKAELFRRFKGMFWGLVVGDCLGSPIQFTEKDRHPRVTEMLPCRHFGTPPGYWTDDSAMAFCVAESIVRLGRYDLTDIGNNFVRWYNNGFWSSLPYAFDVGQATHLAVRRIEQGSLRNGDEESQGNGSIMRFAPSYILNYGNADRHILHEISDLTHCSGKVRETVDLMARICDDHMQGKRTGVKSLYKTRAEVNNSGWAVSTLQAALWAFETTSSFEDGLIEAVNLGGDADSIGAVFGQIAGSYYGYDAIPEHWLNAVKDRRKIDELIEALIHCTGC